MNHFCFCRCFATPFLWLTGFVVATVLVGCVPPVGVVSSQGCHVLQPLATTLQPHASIRIRVAEPLPSLSLAEADPVANLNPSQNLQRNRLRNALIEALGQRDDLLFEIVGSAELQAYHSHLEDKNRTDQSGDWEFGTSGFGDQAGFNLSALLNPEEWESATYEVVGLVGDESYTAESYTNPISGSTGSSYVPSATVRVRLFARDSGQLLLDVSIPVRGEDAMAEAARRFAGELAAQVWGAAEDKGQPDRGL